MSSTPPTSLPSSTSVPASPTPLENPSQTPAGGSLSSRSHTMVQSPPPDNNIPTPAPLSRSSTLVQTPAISHGQSRQDRGGYFSSRRTQPATTQNFARIPDNNSMPSLSPGLSPAGSFNSSDTGVNRCSYSSSEYLSPPHFQGDDDKPPHISRSESSESLSMMKEKPRREETIPNDRKVRVKRRRRRRYGRRQQTSEGNQHHEHASWEQSVCQLAPTAPTGQKHLCTGHAGPFVPSKTRHGHTDTFGRVIPQSTQGPASLVVTRRWSSVEVGARQKRLPKGLQSTTSKVAICRATSKDNNDESNLDHAGHRYKSSSFTRGGKDHEIVSAIREKLTVRKVDTPGLGSLVAPPLSITLRRASDASGSIFNRARERDDQNHSSVGNSGLMTPLAGAQHVPGDKQPSAGYLITNEDIESISLLIKKSLGQYLHSYDRNSILDESSSAGRISRNTRAPTISGTGGGKPDLLSTDITTNTVDFQPSHSRPSDQNECLEVKDFQMNIQRSGSDKSVHELLWQESKSSSGEASSNPCDTPPESKTSLNIMSEECEVESGIEKGNAFDPQNARASISDWSGRLSQNDVPIVITSTVDFQPSHSRPSDQNECLEVKDFQMNIQRSGSDKSVHELLWQESKSSSGEASSNPCDTPPESKTSLNIMSEECEVESGIEKGNAFDPQNARASISDWSGRLSQNDVPIVITSSDSDSNEATPKVESFKARRRPQVRSAASTPRVATRIRPFPRYAASHEQLQDVVSFPPLSNRKATNEWISPLPDMEIKSPLSTPPLTNSGSLYEIGVDFTTGPSGATTSKSPITSWVRSAEASPSQSPEIDFRQDYGFGGMSATTKQHNDSRRKSSIKPHPKASPRTGQTFAMGSSIGVHASERRKSSSPHIQRVRTIDNIHKGERDEPASRWRSPSVCPPRLSPSQLSPSPVEAEEIRDQKPEDRVPEMMSRLHRLRSGFTDRISLVEARTPPLPRSDCAGIYGTITGTLRRSIGTSCQDNAATHNCDDCAKDPWNPSVDWIG